MCVRITTWGISRIKHDPTCPNRKKEITGEDITWADICPLVDDEHRKHHHHHHFHPDHSYNDPDCE